MLVQVAGHEFVKMAVRAFAGVDGVVAIWVRHDGEGLVVGNELVDELFDALVVNVVVASAVNDEEIALQ